MCVGVCACVRACECVCACVRACVCVCAHVGVCAYAPALQPRHHVKQPSLSSSGHAGMHQPRTQQHASPSPAGFPGSPRLLMVLPLMSLRTVSSCTSAATPSVWGLQGVRRRAVALRQRSVRSQLLGEHAAGKGRAPPTGVRAAPIPGHPVALLLWVRARAVCPAEGSMPGTGSRRPG